MSSLHVAEDIGHAYHDVRNDSTSTDWAVFGYDSDLGGSEANHVRLQASGSDGVEGMVSQFRSGIPAFGFLRVTSGDEMSRRAKFVFISWVPSDTKVMRKAKISVHKAFVKEVVVDFACEFTAEHMDELTPEVIMSGVRRAGGADYGSSSS